MASQESPADCLAGQAASGPFNSPTLVSNWTQFSTTFGDFMEGSYLGHAVYGYMMNGGGNAYIVRVGGNGSAPMPTARAELTNGSPELVLVTRLPARTRITVQPARNLANL